MSNLGGLRISWVMLGAVLGGTSVWLALHQLQPEPLPVAVQFDAETLTSAEQRELPASADLSALEARLVELSIEIQDLKNAVEQGSADSNPQSFNGGADANGLSDSLQQVARTKPNEISFSEDWFWQSKEPGVFELGAISAPLQSQVCQGSWCRLELPEESVFDPGGVQENEFILSLIEAAGTDLEIRTPTAQNGVYFIKPAE